MSVEAVGNGRDNDDEVEEAVKPDIVKRGLADRLPTEAELEEHMVTHLPFRSWCSHCVKGRAVAGKHQKNVLKPESTISTVHMDYCYMVKEGEQENEYE